MNSNIKLYFDAHTNANTLYFTADGQCFFRDADAKSHAQALAKADKNAGSVTTVTRDQVKAWWPGEARRRLGEAQSVLVKAAAAKVAAEEALAAVPAKANNVVKGKAQNAVKLATIAEDGAQRHVDSCQEDVDKVAEILYTADLAAAEENLAKAKAGDDESAITAAQAAYNALVKSGE